MTQPKKSIFQGKSRSNSLKVFEKLEKDLIKTIRADRDYRMPKDYISWEALSGIACISLATCQPEYMVGDMSGYMHSNLTSLWFSTDAPIYCITKELFEAFDNTDALHKPNVLEGWKPSLPSFLIALPKGLLYSPEDGEVDYIVVSCSSKDFSLETQKVWNKIKIPEVVMKYDLYFQWASVDCKETVWFSGTAIAEDGSLFYQIANNLGLNRMNDRDIQFVERIRNLVINILLCLEYSPDLLESLSEAEKQAVSRAKGFAPTQRNNNARYPRWLGKRYQRKQDRTESTGTHASPQTHWRRGHWRMLEPGEDKPWKEAKRLWSEPVLVNG